MTNPDARATSARRRRQAGLWVLRSLAATNVLAALYYLLPLDRLASVPLAVILVVGLLILIDALYFTVTTFSTVGYGDITAVGQSARLMVTAQMILDLLALGLGIRVFIGAVQLARQAHRDPADPAASPGQQPQ
jgi:voltage-gated potassium channel